MLINMGDVRLGFRRLFKKNLYGIDYDVKSRDGLLPSHVGVKGCGALDGTYAVDTEGWNRLADSASDGEPEDMLAEALSVV